MNMITTSYDPEADGFYARFAMENVVTDGSEEVVTGVFFEYDQARKAIGIKVVDVRSRSHPPKP